MKYLLIPLALVAGSAFACPGEGGKDAMAPTVGKPIVAAKNTPRATPAVTAAPTKAATTVAAKSTEPRKPAPQ